MIYPTETKVYCRSCNDLIFVFDKDYDSNETISHEHACKDKGQAPFFHGEKMVCKNCGSRFDKLYNVTIVFNEEMI